MKKVLFISPSLVGAGAERVLCNILNNLDRSRFDVTLLLVLKADNKFLDILAKDIKVIDLASTKSLKANAFKVLNVVRKLKPDSVFVANGHLGLILSPFLIFFRKYKWVVRETNYVSMNVEGFYSKLFYRLFYNNYEYIISQCQDMADDLIENFNIHKEKIVIINNPVDLKVIESEVNAVGDADKTLYPSDKINILACGRLTYQKGFDLLIKEFSVLDNRERFYLTIIGDGEGDRRDVSGQLIKLIDELNLRDSVRIIGFKKDIYLWMKSADLFVLSSRFEGFSNVLLEAIYCGLPVLVNKCPGGVSEVVDDARVGSIFEFSSGGFGKALSEIDINSDPDKEIFRKNYISSKYGVSVIVSKIEEIL